MADTELSSDKLFSIGKKMAVCFAFASATAVDFTHGEPLSSSNIDVIVQQDCSMAHPSLLKRLFGYAKSKNALKASCTDKNTLLEIDRLLNAPYDVTNQSDIDFRNNYKKIQRIIAPPGIEARLESSAELNKKSDNYTTTETRKAPKIPTVNGFQTISK